MKKTCVFKKSLFLVIILMIISTSAFAISLPNTVLNLNSRGEDVVAVQNALNKIGNNLAVDGIYGVGTKQAVLNFQKTQLYLKNDGIYGPSTKISLEIALNKDNNGNTNSKIKLPSGILKYGSKGDGVLAIQKTLNLIGYGLVEDGVFGRSTQKALVNYQVGDYRLANDGIYGPSTRASLQLLLDEYNAEFGDYT